jgi:uroporphyrinogen decarboxylase
MTTPRENTLKAIRFERPDYIPMQFHINAACWQHYDQEALQDLMEAHPFLFPNFQRQKTVTPHFGLNARRDSPYTDPWGCVWTTSEDGITGSVHGHPLPDWSRFGDYAAPDPEKTDGTYPIDWSRIEASVRRQRENGKLVCGGLPHGHTFLRLQDIRGYENLMFDMADDTPDLSTLIGMVAAFNEHLVRNWLALKPDMMSYPEDLGMQVGPMLNPDHFRTFIKPVYRRLMQPARDAGCIVHMHSDGDIRTLVEDLIDGGVDIINLQDLVNGIDWIAERFAGRICIDLDIDRQSITAYGTPRQVDDLIRQEVTRLGRKEGGLMMIYGLYPGVPLENAAALMDAMERYATHYSGAQR